MNQQFKRITRTHLVPCPACWNCIDARRNCTTCNGKGEVSRTINEYVSVTGDEDNEVLLGWAGAME